MVLLLIFPAWLLILTVVVALCSAARRGDGAAQRRESIDRGAGGELLELPLTPPGPHAHERDRREPLAAPAA
jgi:hypothetical protein